MNRTDARHETRQEKNRLEALQTTRQANESAHKQIIPTKRLRGSRKKKSNNGINASQHTHTHMEKKKREDQEKLKGEKEKEEEKEKTKNK